MFTACTHTEKKSFRERPVALKTDRLSDKIITLFISAFIHSIVFYGDYYVNLKNVYIIEMH